VIDFPTSPLDGQDYTYGARTWRWNGYGWVQLVNQGQGVAVFTPTLQLVTVTVEGLPYLITFGFHQIDYV
jgi:hypothetical protein